MTSTTHSYLHRQALQRAAHTAATKAVRLGELPPATEFKCVSCGSQADAWDHRDYRRPLDVQAVCGPYNSRLPRALPLAPKRSHIPDDEATSIAVVLPRHEMERLEQAAAASHVDVEQLVAAAATRAAEGPGIAPGLPVIRVPAAVCDVLDTVAVDFAEWAHGGPGVEDRP